MIGKKKKSSGTALTLCLALAACLLVACTAIGAESKRFTNNIGMDFVLIPAGSFMMGGKFSPEETAKRFGGKAKWFIKEHPRHRVTISKAFYMQTTEVTQAQWAAIMGNNPSHFRACGDDCPVESFHSKDVHEFIRKLNQKEETNKYRLPTEAEWEYAARAGSQTSYCFGDHVDSLGEYGWYKSNSGCKSHRVAGKKPNRWGLYDVYGNVLELVQDCYQKNYYASSPKEDPLSKNCAGGLLVLRGGLYLSPAVALRSAFRDKLLPGRAKFIGFRLAKDAP